MPLTIASSRSSLEIVKSLNFFFIGDCSISLFRSPLSAEALMMGPMQSGLKFTDRITQYVAKWAELTDFWKGPSWRDSVAHMWQSEQSERLSLHRRWRVTWSPLCFLSCINVVTRCRWVYSVHAMPSLFHVKPVHLKSSLFQVKSSLFGLCLDFGFHHCK